MVITSVHIGVEEGSEFTQIVNEVRRILHEYGIHSSSIQPEFVPRTQEVISVLMVSILNLFTRMLNFVNKIVCRIVMRIGVVKRQQKKERDMSALLVSVLSCKIM